MAFERNVGGTDRIARAVGGVGLLVVTLVAVLAGRWALATGAALARVIEAALRRAIATRESEEQPL